MTKIQPANVQSVAEIGYRRNADIWTGTGFWLMHFAEELDATPSPVSFIDPADAANPPAPIYNTSKVVRFFLVTAKHVIDDLLDKGLGAIIARFNSKTDNTSVIVEIDLLNHDREPCYFSDPVPGSDCSVLLVDISAIISSGLDIGFFTSDTDVLKLAAAKAASVGEGDQVFVIGFPLKINHLSLKLPIVRAGIIARIQDAYLETDRHFLIDSFAFPGASGSPVILAPDTEPNASGRFSANSWKLIGLVSRYEQYVDEAVSEETNTTIIIRSNSGLARICAVDAIDRAIAQAIAANRATVARVRSMV